VPQAKLDEEIRQQKNAEVIETERKGSATAEARKTMESVYENTELLESIVGYGKNNTFIDANFKSGYTGLGHVSSIQIDTQKVSQIFETDKKPENGWRESNAESVLFIPVIEQDFHTEVQERVVEKRRFGKDVVQKFEHKEAVPNSEHQKIILNTETGQEEPAILFRYDFNGMQFSGLSEINYCEYSGFRDGGMLTVAVELPKSIATKLLLQIQEDPSYVRKVVEGLIMNNSKEKVEPSDWVDREASEVPSMKPPYKKLREIAPDWKLAIATPNPNATLNELAGYKIAQHMQVKRHRVHG
jgi:hypothetical protein